MSQLTILFLYTVAAQAFALSRFPQHSSRAGYAVAAAFLFCLAGVVLHGCILFDSLFPGGAISLSTAVSLIGIQLALTALLAAFNASLRGVSAGLLLLAAFCALASGRSVDLQAGTMSWQIQVHVLTSMFAYGLLTVGAIVAIYALVQDRRLRSGKLSSFNNLFAPLETTERMLFAVCAAGFTVLALSVVSGITFVEDLFAQHLVHKTALSILALLLFGLLLLGRQFAGWRGTRAVYLYLGSFVVLSLAYFGSRYILEQLLGRSWG